jgi:iron complex transport system substrate-binding protein
MKKWYSIVLTLLLAVGIMTGCGTEKEDVKEEVQTEANQEEAAFPVTLTDALDEEIVIEKKPEKIVSLIPSNTEIIYELGLGEEVVGVTDFDNYPEDAMTKEKIGGMEFNVEKIISLEPDLVLAHASGAHNSKEGLQQLKDSGISVFVVEDATSFETTYETIITIGQATGEKAKAEQMVADMKAKVEEIKTKVAEVSEEKNVFVEVSGAPEIFTAGKNTFIDEMLSIIHAKNVAGNLDGWPMLEQETIISLNPEVIITTYGYYTENAVQQVLAREGWQGVSAIQNQLVFDVHSDLVTRPGPRLVEGVEELAKTIYPEVFNQ